MLEADARLSVTPYTSNNPLYKIGDVFDCLFVCLFVLRLNVPVNNFSVKSGRSQRFLGLSNTVGSQYDLLKVTTG